MERVLLDDAKEGKHKKENTEGVGQFMLALAGQFWLAVKTIIDSVNNRSTQHTHTLDMMRTTCQH